MLFRSIAGMVVPLAALGVFGFVVMLTGAVITYFAFRATGSSSDESGEETPGDAKPRPSKRSSEPGFMDRMEERWRKRSEGER